MSTKNIIYGQSREARASDWRQQELVYTSSRTDKDCFVLDLVTENPDRDVINKYKLSKIQRAIKKAFTFSCVQTPLQPLVLDRKYIPVNYIDTNDDPKLGYIEIAKIRELYKWVFPGRNIDNKLTGIGKKQAKVVTGLLNEAIIKLSQANVSLTELQYCELPLPAYAKIPSKTITANIIYRCRRRLDKYFSNFTDEPLETDIGDVHLSADGYSGRFAIRSNKCFSKGSTKYLFKGIQFNDINSRDFESYAYAITKKDKYKYRLTIERKVKEKVGHYPHIMPLGKKIRGGEQQKLYKGDATILRKMSLAKKILGLIDMATGLRYLHKAGIVHYDVKLENALVDENDRVDIADFDSIAKKNDIIALKRFRGTPQYFSYKLAKAFVEGHTNNLHYMPEAHPGYDVWSLGVAICMLIYGTPRFVKKAFPHTHKKNLLASVKVLYETCEEYAKNGTFTKGLKKQGFKGEEELHELLKEIFVLDPNKRPSMGEVRGALIAILRKQDLEDIKKGIFKELLDEVNPRKHPHLNTTKKKYDIRRISSPSD